MNFCKISAAILMGSMLNLIISFGFFFFFKHLCIYLKGKVGKSSRDVREIPDGCNGQSWTGLDPAASSLDLPPGLLCTHRCLVLGVSSTAF